MEYGCIGEHLSHSFSKEIHNALADYDYVLKELSKDEITQFFEKRDFKAINVTIPYKKDVIPFLDWVSPEAQSIGAVNTIVNRDGKLYGYNTDFFGLKSLIERQNVSLLGKKVAVLGSGGTSNTAFAVAKSMGAREIIKVSRSEKDGYVTYENLYAHNGDVQIIINTTPCGMYPNIGEAAVDSDKLMHIEAVFDAVYNPLKSKLVCDAIKHGCTASGGLYMLVAQAAYAVEKFIGSSVDMSLTQKVFENLYKQKANIVLVGMPSCGKTTVGKELAKRLGKTFVDTDEVIVRRTGKDISQIFAQEGEAAFRKIEKDVINDIAASNNTVIATGGGAVLNSENTDILKENGRLYFIDRPIEMLVTSDDRPLSSNREALEKRFAERYGIYKGCADSIIDGAGTVEETVERIEAEFNEYSCN